MSAKTTDDLQKTIALKTTAPRVVSLVPSHTETLIDLGIQVVGRTKFCIHPKDKVPDITVVGGTKNPNIEKILALKPDLIIANKEENNQADVLKLELQCAVYTSDIQTVEGSLTFIQNIGKLCNKTVEAKNMVIDLQETLEIVAASPLNSLYLIWRDPWMTIGGDTYIDNMMKKLGFRNLFHHTYRYPEISSESMRNLRPDIVLLSSEPYPFKEEHIQEIKKLLPQAECVLVDGEIFSWYGSRLLHKPNELKNIAKRKM